MFTLTFGALYGQLSSSPPMVWALSFDGVERFYGLFMFLGLYRRLWLWFGVFLKMKVLVTSGQTFLISLSVLSSAKAYTWLLMS
jgi:hypothetical protein